MKWFLALLLFGAAPAQAAAFDPVDFFRGRTHGEGVLKIIFQSPKRISVDSFGYPQKNGSLLLKQIIREPGKKPRTRYWRLRQTGRNSYTSTLTDAAGPVRVDVAGQRVRIRYRDKHYFDFDQWLTPAGPGKVANSLSVKFLGITVARLKEVIRKNDR